MNIMIISHLQTRPSLFVYQMIIIIIPPFQTLPLLFICAIADDRYDHFTELAIALVMKESGYLVASLRDVTMVTRPRYYIVVKLCVSSLFSEQSVVV